LTMYPMTTTSKLYNIWDTQLQLNFGWNDSDPIVQQHWHLAKEWKTSVLSRQQYLRDHLRSQFYSSSISVLSSTNSQATSPALGLQATLNMLQFLFNANHKHITPDDLKWVHKWPSNGQKTLLYDLTTESPK
jgi:hypothetical protein